MTKKKRAAALLLAVVVFFAIMLSLTLLSYESNHDCIGEDCQVCAQLASARERMKSVFAAVVAFAVAFALTYIHDKGAVCSARSFAQGTLVALKVELLNEIDAVTQGIGLSV